MKEATLHDVAKLAGVSTGTVSKYINGIPVSPKNKARVQAAINVLHYTPSPLARSFASGKSYMISLLIIAESPIVDSTWQHELPIIHGITAALQDTAYSLKIEIASVQNVEENARRLDSYTRNKYTDGIILLSPWDISEKLTIPLDYREFPYVVIGRESSERKHGCIDFDNCTPIYEIVHDMYHHGCRRFGMIGGFRDQRHMVSRETGFRSALAQLQVPIDEQLIKFGNYSLQSGYSCAMELLAEASPPTGIVCGNDYIASGAIRAIKEKGYRIPEDILVSGFDHTVVSDATDPTITTVRVPTFDIGSLAMRELHKKLEDRAYTIPNHLIQCEVVKKQSTAAEAIR